MILKLGLRDKVLRDKPLRKRYKSCFLFEFMILNVPFYPQTTKLDCGPVALKMVLAFFKEDFDLNILEQRIGIKEGRGVYTIEIAIAVALLGYKTEFLCKQTTFNKEYLKLDFYQKYTDTQNISEELERLLEKAKKIGVKVEEKTIDLNELLNKVTKESIPIVLIDWNVVKGVKEKGYHGHFVPVVGYDDKIVYIHNPGLKDPQAFLSVNKEVFDEARKSKGTDEDIVIIYNKR